MKKLLTLIMPALVLTAGAPQADAFGAFALDEAAWAFAFAGGERTQAEAEQRALSLCAQEGGRDCVIKYQYTGSRCGAAALAEEQGLRAWGFGHADSRAEAIINAINFCKSENTSGGTCRKVAVACGDAAPRQVADAAPQAPQADRTNPPQADAREGAPQAANAQAEANAIITKAILDRAEFWFELSSFYYREGHYKNLEPAADRAIELDPENARAYLYRGISKKIAQDPEGAQADFDLARGAADRAIELDPDNARAYLLRGQTATTPEDTKLYLDRAMAAADRAIELDPENTEAYYTRGLAKKTCKIT